jgi:hypothetical protein
VPEQVAHKGQKDQFEIVAILGLIATHMHIFWIAGLLLAFIDLPDFSGFLGRIGGRIAGVKPGPGADGEPDHSRPMHAASPGHVVDAASPPRESYC